MGFYIRKTIRLGGLNFNISKSGIGVTAGFKGLKIGSGSRGNYIHMGTNGVYFGRSVSRSQKNPAGKDKSPSASRRHQASVSKTSSLDEMIDIESGEIMSMSDSSSQDLLNELNSKSKKIPLTKLSYFTAFCLFIGIMQTGWDYAFLAGAALAFLIVLSMRYYDEVRRTAIILYDLEESSVRTYQNFHEAFARLKTCEKAWHIPSTAKVLDGKYHAGADKLISRKLISMISGNPSHITTNIEVPIIPVGKQTLAFFPDRLLVIESGKIGAVEYHSLSLSITSINIIEEGAIPNESEKVGSTWRYVNKKGGPDKRFKNNYEIPIVKYEHLHFESANGLNELICISRVGAGETLRSAIESLAKHKRELESKKQEDGRSSGAA